MNFSANFLDSLSRKAESLDRRRLHFNIHASYQSPSQKLFNAVSVDSYIRPHRHLLDPKSETLLAVRGEMSVIYFDDDGHVKDVIDIAPVGSGSVGVEVAPGVWHTVVVHQPRSILFEVKDGPFDPLSAKEFAAWSPAEGDVNVAAYLQLLKAYCSRS